MPTPFPANSGATRMILLGFLPRCMDLFLEGGGRTFGKNWQKIRGVVE